MNEAQDFPQAFLAHVAQPEQTGLAGPTHQAQAAHLARERLRQDQTDVSGRPDHRSLGPAHVQTTPGGGPLDAVQHQGGGIGVAGCHRDLGIVDRLPVVGDDGCVPTQPHHRGGKLLVAELLSQGHGVPDLVLNLPARLGGQSARQILRQIRHQDQVGLQHAPARADLPAKYPRGIQEARQTVPPPGESLAIPAVMLEGWEVVRYHVLDLGRVDHETDAGIDPLARIRVHRTGGEPSGSLPLSAGNPMSAQVTEQAVFVVRGNHREDLVQRVYQAVDLRLREGHGGLNADNGGPMPVGAVLDDGGQRRQQPDAMVLLKVAGYQQGQQPLFGGRAQEGTRFRRRLEFEAEHQAAAAHLRDDVWMASAKPFQPSAQITAPILHPTEQLAAVTRDQLQKL